MDNADQLRTKSTFRCHCLAFRSLVGNARFQPVASMPLHSSVGSTAVTRRRFKANIFCLGLGGLGSGLNVQLGSGHRLLKLGLEWGAFG